ncbi:DUF4158 domain-containing protein [Hymenobacter sp. ISL-91]|uniref:DUF4158 domain-containing protein n=1 Tax=Hymenobacter TaxID=89966 RepID=UPI000377E2D7|nr:MULTISPECIES: DUF4158 domain-containing protein [Hymenobacter]MBT2557967.1 DUF4158 domain-containing protein [Hymenobacter sp. ISL-91]
MPVEFLSDEQAARYGRFHTDPSPEQLARFFYLSPDDLVFVARRRRRPSSTDKQECKGHSQNYCFSDEFATRLLRPEKGVLAGYFREGFSNAFFSTYAGCFSVPVLRLLEMS